MIREWIKSCESWEQETAQLGQKEAAAAKRITMIEVAVGSDEIEGYSRGSKLNQLQRLKEKLQSGEIMLSLAEEKAISKWIGDKQRQQPVSAKLNGLTM